MTPISRRKYPRPKDMVSHSEMKTGEDPLIAYVLLWTEKRDRFFFLRLTGWLDGGLLVRCLWRQFGHEIFWQRVTGLQHAFRDDDLVPLVDAVRIQVGIDLGQDFPISELPCVPFGNVGKGFSVPSHRVYIVVWGLYLFDFRGLQFLG